MLARLGGVMRERQQAARTSYDEHRRAADASLRVLLDALSDAVVVHRAGRIVYANAAAVSAFGYRLEELIGRSPLDFVPRQLRWLVAERILKTYGSHEVALPYRERFIHADGHEVAVEVLALPIIFDGTLATLVHIRVPPASTL